MTTSRPPRASRPTDRKPKIATPDELAKAWSPGPPSTTTWTPRPWVTPPSAPRRVEPLASALRGRATPPSRRRRARSRRDHPGPGGGPPPGPPAAPSRSDGRSRPSPSIAGRRRSWPSTSPTTPRTDIIVQAMRRRPPVELRTLRVARTDPRLRRRTTSTRRCPGRGSGTSSGWPSAS